MKPSIFRVILKNTLLNVLGLDDRWSNAEFDYNADGTILTVDIDNYKFVIDLIEGMYRIVEQDPTIDSELDFYIGNKPKEDGTSPIIPARGTNIGVDWAHIVALDSLIGAAKRLAYTELSQIFYDTTPQYTPNRFITRFHKIVKYAGHRFDGLNLNQTAILYMGATANLLGCDPDINTIGVRLYENRLHLTKKGIDKLKEIYDYHLSKVLILNRFVKEGCDPEFDTVIFPNYMDNYSVTIFTNIGYPEYGYSGVEDWSFFLTINPLVFNCKYSNDVPWTDRTADLFSMDPREISTEMDKDKNALCMVIERVFSEIASDKFKLLSELYTTDEESTGFKTSSDRVSLFVNELKKNILLNYAAPDKETMEKAKSESNWVKWKSFSDGITIIVVGSVYIEIALDGPGLVDIALDHDITKEEDWGDIFYCKDLSDDVLNVNRNFGDADNLCVRPKSIESDVLLQDIGKTCSGIMYQKMMEDEDNEIG